MAATGGLSRGRAAIMTIADGWLGHVEAIESSGRVLIVARAAPASALSLVALGGGRYGYDTTPGAGVTMRYLHGHVYLEA